jgi:hypothetical protein
MEIQLKASLAAEFHHRLGLRERSQSARGEPDPKSCATQSSHTESNHINFLPSALSA